MISPLRHPPTAVCWLANAATIGVVAQCFAVDGYLLLLLVITGAFAIIPTLAFLAARQTAKKVRQWERVWAQESSSLAPIVVLLLISSIMVPVITTFVSFWEVEKGNGPVVCTGALFASSLAVAVYAKFGPRLRWIVPASGVFLLGTAAWIEVDRWWLIAVLAGYKAGFGAFVDRVDWAWPPHAVTVLLSVVGILVLLHWMVERRMRQEIAERPGATRVVDINVDSRPSVPGPKAGGVDAP